MKLFQVLLAAGMTLAIPAAAQAQVAGSTLLGVSATEMRDVAAGWSAKRTVLGHQVYNDKDEKIGSIDDIIIAPDKAISYAIVNVGGFTGLTKHDVAVPVSQFKQLGQKLVLVGATKDELKKIPTFEYAQH